MEQALSGGNTHDQVVRIAQTVRRPTGPWTPGVHALLNHLEELSYGGAPRVHGIDDQGREVLDYVEGDVVHPDHPGLIESDAALAAVVESIRRFHDAATSFTDFERFRWSDRGGDTTGANEILCHNDLAPWNLVHARGGSWVFIDWDLAAPGRRSWDLSWALLSMVPLMPGSDISDRRLVERIAVFRSAYGRAAFPEDVLAVAVERCAREADLIDRLGTAGEPPYDRLLRDGHGDIWHAAATNIASNAADWQSALNNLG